MLSHLAIGKVYSHLFGCEPQALMTAPTDFFLSKCYVYSKNNLGLNGMGTFSYL